MGGVRSRVTPFSLLLLTAALSGCPGCPDRAAAPDAAPSTSEDEGNNVQPVYGAAEVKVPPLVARVCQALHRIPKERKAACCGESLGIELTGPCEQALAVASNDGAVTLDEAKVAACEAAISAHYQGCDWMGPQWQELPSACRGLYQGNRPAGARCRSSLECVGDLRCLGAGPTDLGQCGPAAAPGTLCGTAVDALAVYTRQDDYERTHPACAQGYCDRNRCQAAKASGVECVASLQCGPGARCAGQVCVSGERGAEGEGCSGADCALGLRCVLGRCTAPKPAGAACTHAGECRGGCLYDDGGASGQCGQSCDTAPILKRLSVPLRRGTP